MISKDTDEEFDKCFRQAIIIIQKLGLQNEPDANSHVDMAKLTALRAELNRIHKKHALSNPEMASKGQWLPRIQEVEKGYKGLIFRGF